MQIRPNLLVAALLCFSFGCAEATSEENATEADDKSAALYGAKLPSASPSAGSKSEVAPSAGANSDVAPNGDDSADSDDEELPGTDAGALPAAPAAPAASPAAPSAPAAPAPAAPAPAPAPTSGSSSSSSSSASAGPAPAGACSITKDSEGFFTRTSAKSPYVAFVPKTYSASTPMRVIVGLHGCSDNAANFARWGVNPWEQRGTQQYIGISVGGETGNNKCWAKGVDDDKVLAAVDDLAKCFWLDRSKVVIAGYSSGGELAYRVAMKNASAFAGVLIENSALYAAGAPRTELLAGAAWKLPIAHLHHVSDSVFPIAKVREDWSATRSAGFPTQTTEVAGGHDGAGADWSGWLLPRAASWTR